MLLRSEVLLVTGADEYLDAHELFTLHQLDQLDFKERDMVMAADLQWTGKLQIQGKPTCQASIYSSTTMVLGEREHELPI